MVFTNSIDGPVSETATPCTAPLLRTFNVTTHASMASATIGVLMSHTYRGDLRFFLTAPDATRIQLGANIGTSRANVNVLFADAAAAAYTTHTAANDTATSTTVVPPYQRTFRPSAAMSSFAGKDAFGTWTLEICDSLNADSGTYFHSTLTITTQPATMSVVKTSTVVSDPVNGTANPFAIPGSIVRYCLLISNNGPGISSTIVASDSIPALEVYVAGSIRSGATCATATTVEDDDGTGADETDVVGATYSGGTIQVSSVYLTGLSSFAVTFQTAVQ